MPSHHRKATTIARKGTELALAVPEVMAHRLTRIYLAGANPSARQIAEMQRMTTEKVVAFSLAYNAMAVELLRAYLRVAIAPVSWITSRAMARSVSAHTMQTAMGMVTAGLAPIHRRATANARRLRRSRTF